MKKLLSILLLLPALGVANTNTDLLTYKEQSEEALKNLQGFDAQSILDSSIKSKGLFSSQIASLKKDQASQSNSGGKTADGAILFVSSSMPRSLLLGLIDESSHYKIPVVIKGLVKGDFNKTIEFIGHLKLAAQKENKKFEGVSINPVWFDTFNITKVPALVVTKRPLDCMSQSDCPNQTYDVVSGDINLEKSLTLLSKKGENASIVAVKILLIALFLSFSVSANQTGEDFQKYLGVIKEHQGMDIKAMQEFDVKKNIEQYSESPAESDYYTVNDQSE